MSWLAGSLRVAAWIALVAAVGAASWAAGVGRWAWPPTDPAAWMAWLERRGPAAGLVAIVRLAVLAASGYVLVVTGLTLAVRHRPRPSLRRIQQAAVVPAIEGIVRGATGLSVAAGTLVANAAVAAPAASTAAASVATRVVAEAGSPGAARATGEPPTLRRLPDVPPAPPHVVASPAPPHGEWEVVPGDHLWSIAERILAMAWERVPADDETARYWRTLVAANRSRLADPANPDLLFAGQRLHVPPPPVATQ